MICAYGTCDHPMIRQDADGTWRCTECGAAR